MTLPLAVILNRLAAAFFVLMPLGRRINLIQLQKSAKYTRHIPMRQAQSLPFGIDQDAG
jgi:hypothetical protein